MYSSGHYQWLSRSYQDTRAFCSKACEVSGKTHMNILWRILPAYNSLEEVLSYDYTKDQKGRFGQWGIASRTHPVSWHLPVLNLNTSIWKFGASIYVGEGASGICLNLGDLTQNDDFQVYPFTCEFHDFIFYTWIIFHWDYVSHILSICQSTIVMEQEGAQMSKRLCRRRHSLGEHA